MNKKLLALLILVTVLISACSSIVYPEASSLPESEIRTKLHNQIDSCQRIDVVTMGRPAFDDFMEHRVSEGTRTVLDIRFLEFRRVHHAYEVTYCLK